MGLLFTYEEESRKFADAQSGDLDSTKGRKMVSNIFREAS
jgi:hypothetical protein